MKKLFDFAWYPRSIPEPAPDPVFSPREVEAIRELIREELARGVPSGDTRTMGGDDSGEALLRRMEDAARRLRARGGVGLFQLQDHIREWAP